MLLRGEAFLLPAMAGEVHMEMQEAKMQSRSIGTLRAGAGATEDKSPASQEAGYSL